MKSIGKFIFFLIVIGIIFLLIVFGIPFLILLYAEEQFLIDNFKKNKEEFEYACEIMLSFKAQYGYDEMSWSIDYDKDGNRILNCYKKEEVDYVDASNDIFDKVTESFGDYYCNKIDVTNEGISFSEENNHFALVYTYDEKYPTIMINSGKVWTNAKKIKDGWYLVTSD